MEDLRQRVTKAVTRVMPRWLDSRRDDLVQASMVRILEIIERRERNDRFPTSYLQKVAHAVLVDEIRKFRRRREEALTEEAEARYGKATVDTPELPALERQAQAREAGAAISACLRALRESRRQALVLYLQGYSVPEAAGHLGWTVKKTENLVYRGLGDLRGCLRQKGIEP